MPKRRKETATTPKTKSGHILGEQEELFCQAYVRTFNRIESILSAYNIDREKANWRKTASVMAYDLLIKPYVNERLRELLDEQHVNAEEIDKETAFLMRQSADLSNKRGAIDIFNRLLGRYEKDNEQKKTEVNVYNWGNYEEENDNNIQTESVD